MIRLIKWWIFLVVGFYLNATLTIWPLSQASLWYRPQWFFMFVILCQLTQPTLFNPLIAFAIGLLMDSLLGTPLGLYAFICSILSYLTFILRSNFMGRPLWLQLEKILALVCLGQIVVLWFHAFTGQNPQTLLYWMGSVSSCVMWPLYVFVFQGINQLLRVTPFLSRASSRSK